MKRIILIALMILVVACSPAEEAAPKATEDSLQVSGAIHSVSIQDFSFAPTTLEIKAGDTVEWVNSDAADHTITLENGDFDEQLPQGTTVRHTFQEAGEFRYFCQLHPRMQGTVLVS